jgi:superfamily II DNA helicase RecQ
MSRKRRASSHVVLSPEGPPLSEVEQRLILETADAMVYEAGRSTLVLALRGSKNKKLDKFKAETLPGFGYYRGLPEEEVLARVDQLIHQELLKIDTSHDGYPLLGYTPKGLELAEQWGAERWLTELRGHFDDSTPYVPSFAHERMPNRNLKTLNHLIDALQIHADIAWLPFLRHWRERETARIRRRLDPMIERLNGIGR